MNPSSLLKKFLSTGNKPANQREVSSLLDESRSLLISRLPTTGKIMMNFTEAELDSVDIKGGNVLQQMHKIYAGKQKANAANQPRPSASPARPAASAKPSPARPAPKPINSMTTNPPSTTPHLDQFEKLEGTAASHFYATHGAAIRAESGTRKHEAANLQKEMSSVRATARQRADLKKITR
jgi:hypothetical protein